MGLYDLFVAPPEVVCPTCGVELGQFQTKGLCEGMGLFRIGESVHLEDDDLFIHEGTLRCYGGCSACKNSLEGTAVVREGRNVAFELVAVKPRAR